MVGFVNNNPTSEQKLQVIVFGCGWLGWNWIATRKHLANFFKFLCTLDKSLKIDYSLFFRGEKT